MAPNEQSQNLWHRILLFITGLLVLPALMVNLDMMSFIDDEGIRSLVAFEMMQSGDYIQSTLNGEPYFKKPPLYNWILAAVFSITGEVSEWTARVTTVFFLLTFCFLIYRGVSQCTKDRDLGLVAALLTLTCGRILFWDSFLGLIDICFSALIFGNFLWLYTTHRKEKMWAYFVGSWFLAALAFLLKGLPGLVFQILTVGGHLLWHKQWRRMFHPAQWVGGLLFLSIVGTYYFLLFKGASPEQVFSTLFNESAQRTPTHHGFGKTIMHILAFPFEMSYHFLPWSLLLVFLWPLRTLKARLNHPLIIFFIVVFAVNIPVYWVSPQVYPRYLLMLAPLVFTVGYWLYKKTPDSSSLKQVFQGFFLGVGSLLALAAWLPLFLPQTQEAQWLWPKTLFLVATMSLAVVAMWRFRRLLIYALVVQLLTLRLAFDWFVLPDRLIHDAATVARDDARRIGTEHVNKPLFFLDEVCVATTASFYLATHRGEITRVWRDHPQPNVSYIISGDHPLPEGCKVTDTLRVRHFNDRTPYVLLIQKAPHSQ